MKKCYDYVIFGAGIYGLYAATRLASHNKDKKIMLMEYDQDLFQRASYINQARVHNGYHYPRSITTALKSANYYTRFNKDFSFAINNKFAQIYAISKRFSYTSSDNFLKFCNAAGIACTEVATSKYFKPNMVDGCFLTDEYAFDAAKIK